MVPLRELTSDDVAESPRWPGDPCRDRVSPGCRTSSARRVAPDRRAGNDRAAVSCTTGMRRCASSSMNSARLVPATSAAFDWESSPREYQSRAAAPRISFTNSVGDSRSAESAPSGTSNVSVGIVSDSPASGYPVSSWEKTVGSVRSNGAPQRPVRFYRLSAVCQPKLENVVAGACNQLNLEFSWTAA